MSDDKAPNPLTDLRKGLGLLFRAAKTTARKLPTTNLGREFEQAVVTSAREVGRAIENVATTIEREVRGRTGMPGPPPSKGKDGPSPEPGSQEPKRPDGT